MCGSSSTVLRFSPPIVALLAGSVALIGAASETWTRHGNSGRYDIPYDELAGIDYVQGMATVAVGIALVFASVLYSTGTGSPRFWRTAAIGLSLTALALPLSILLHTVTDMDPGVGSSHRVWQAVDDIGAATGLLDTVTAAMICLAAALTLAVAERQARVTAALPGAGYALAFALLSMASVIMTWDQGSLMWSNLGFEYTAGLITLVAGLNGALAASIALSGIFRPKQYLRWAVVAGVVMLAAPAWFHFRFMGNPDPAYESTMIDCWGGPCGRIEAGVGLMAAMTFGMGYLASIAPLWRQLLPERWAALRSAPEVEA